ncbi:hypothetical protein Goshw_021008 [Gossypium schwendimanii]|uniref:Uncharacterized protein n=1 Tax=Gossypium schwendimanii TaxID=34291 RepID=A0A7J9N982_GOSSC|nr:hypothetical protein [Gossypium schwendimanii]
MEEYTALLHCPRFQVDKAYSRAAIKQKGECKCIPWKNLRDLILAHPNWKKEGRCVCFEYLRISDLP